MVPVHMIATHIPAFIFSGKWLNSDFEPPVGKAERVALRLKLYGYAHYGLMFMEGYENIHKILLERIAILEAYDFPTSKKEVDIPVPAHILSKEWREGNFLIPVDDSVRKEKIEELGKYENATTFSRPSHKRLRAVFLARLAAMREHDKVLSREE